MNRAKYFLLVIFILLFTGSTFSQTEKGTFTIGGELLVTESNATYSSPDYDDTVAKTFSLYLNPFASYFVAQNFSIGISTPFSFGSSSFKVGNNASPGSTDFTYKTKSYSIGPVFRYYVPIKSWAFFLEASHTFEWKAPYKKAKKEIFLSKFGVGATYFFNKHIGIEGLIFYQYKTDTKVYDDFFLNGTYTDYASINFRIGIQVYLSKKNKEAEEK